MVDEPWPHQQVKCPDCGWIGERCEAHHDGYHVQCPECGYEPLESSEPKTPTPTQ